MRDSRVHGLGVFAPRRIRKGTRVIEYLGERISHNEADRRYDDKDANDNHTFLFIVDARTVIDAGVDGNDARFVNHSCDPNCESVIENRRVFIEAHAARSSRARSSPTTTRSSAKPTIRPTSTRSSPAAAAAESAAARCCGRRRRAAAQAAPEQAVRRRPAATPRGAPLSAVTTAMNHQRRLSVSAVVGATGHRVRRHRHEPALHARDRARARPGPSTRAAVLGVLSLIFWSLAISVTLKYIVIIMRADNEGEGGILALFALAQRRLITGSRWAKVAVGLALVGTAFFFCDALITPAISVLGAVEGLEVLNPGLQAEGGAGHGRR